MTDPTRIEAAYIALQAALAAAASDEACVLPPPHRNAALVNALDPTGAGLIGRAFLNVHDDDGQPIGEIAGGSERGEREFYQFARIEWAFERKNDAERDRGFDAGMKAIGDALMADPSLGGAVDDLEIQMPRRADLTLSGAPRIKAALIPVRLLITAPTYLG